jgi:hypothetical protein
MGHERTSTENASPRANFRCAIGRNPGRALTATFFKMITRAGDEEIA